jgi:IMP dehydrogenase
MTSISLVSVNIEREGFTFDDVLLRPLASAMEPAEASLKTKIAGIDLTVPFLSAAMDRVTGPEMAIALGKLGGLGVLHRNCSVEEQVAMVEKVKKAGVKVAAACGPFAASVQQRLKKPEWTR